MEFVKMRAEHVLFLGKIISVHDASALTSEMAVELEEIGNGFTAMDGEKVLGIAGITAKWEGTGMAWAWLSRDWLRHARAITNEIIRSLDETKFERVEVAVKVGFTKGHSWAKRLGFELETPCARKWGPDGASYSIYSRVK